MNIYLGPVPATTMNILEVTMTVESELIDIAIANVDKFLADAISERGSCESVDIFDEAYTLAFDALADMNIPHDVARNIALSVARKYTS